MKNRRGLSTIVGAVFFVIAATTSIVYITYSMDTVDNFAQTIASNEIEQTNKNNEKFEITKVSIDGGKFNFTLQNTGKIPVNLERIWVDNKTDANWTPARHTIDKSISPGAVITNIGQDISVTALDSQAYDIKLVTDRGNTLQFSVNSDVSANLYTNLIAIPDYVAAGFTTTLMLEVVNNMTSNDILTEISPTITCGAILDPITSTIPSNVETLQKGDVAIFKQVFQANGEDGQTTNCNAVLRTGGNSIGPAKVTIQEIAFASQSATSLESEGLTCCKTGDDILAFHGETQAVPSGISNSFQLYSGLPELSGITKELDVVDTIRYFTKNDTTRMVDIPQGDWDLTMVYNSDIIPSTISIPNMIYFFENNFELMDSSGNNIDMTASATPPNIVSDGDVHGYDSAQFDGTNMYYSIPFSVGNNDLGAEPQTTAGWFKIDGTQTGTGTIYRMESSDQAEWYEISFNSSTNKLQFRYFTNGNGAIEVICESSVLSRDTWHFFVAVRDFDDTCKLYVDGNSATTQIQGAAGSGTGAKDIDIDSQPAYLGYNPNTGNYLDGEIGYIMHWESEPITSETLADTLYDTNYGDAAHQLRIEYAITDNDGTELTGSENYIHEETNVLIPFADPQNTNFEDNWHEYVYSQTLSNSSDTSLEYHFGNDNRLKIEFDWVGPATLLGMNLNTDDNGYSDNIGTKLKIPIPSNPFTSYFQWDVNTPLEFTIVNAGPEGMWPLFSGTRVIFSDIQEGNSYAGLLKSFNATSSSANMDPETDGKFLDVGNRGVLEFYNPKTKPTTGLGYDIIPDQHYRMYVSIVGYDNLGSNVFRTFYVGVVNVCDTTC